MQDGYRLASIQRVSVPGTSPKRKPPKKNHPIHRSEYTVAVRALHQMRADAGLNLRQLAAKVGRSFAWAHKSEIGQRRVDFIEFLNWCDACGVSVTKALKLLGREFFSPKGLTILGLRFLHERAVHLSVPMKRAASTMEPDRAGRARPIDGRTSRSNATWPRRSSFPSCGSTGRWPRGGTDAVGFDPALVEGSTHRSKVHQCTAKRGQHYVLRSGEPPAAEAIFG